MWPLFTLYRLLDSLTHFSNNLVIANTTFVTFTRRTFAIQANNIDTSSFQGETFSVNLGSVEDTMGISSAIREEAIETIPGNVTYQNSDLSEQYSISASSKICISRAGTRSWSAEIVICCVFEGHTLSVFR